MTLITFKWTATLTILVISIVAGFASLRFITKYHRLLLVGDAAANGIFIGASLFHLIPEARNAFANLGMKHAFSTSLALAVSSFLLLLAIDRIAYQFQRHNEKVLGAWLITITLTIHALTTGIALGISESAALISIIFIAVIAHKGFEIFAFVVQLHRRLEKHLRVLTIFLLFSLVTPIGILLGIWSDSVTKISTGNLLTAYFNAFAAGTFFYIGTAHRHHKQYHHETDSHHRYNEVVALIFGVIGMGIVGIFI